MTTIGILATIAAFLATASVAGAQTRYAGYYGDGYGSGYGDGSYNGAFDRSGGPSFGGM